MKKNDAVNFNKFANHPLQSFEWGEFRKKSRIKVIREHDLQISIHPIPYTSYNIGYLPKNSMPDKKMLNLLSKIGKREKCIFIQIEPDALKTNDLEEEIESLKLKKSAHPLFTKYTFILDLTKSEEELLKNMHSKTRYNIKIAENHEVEITEDNSEKAFEKYLKLTWETTKRQNFFAHTKNYHRLMWETLKNKSSETDKNILSAHLFTAKYKSKILATWIVFVFKDTLYYPYGASSSESRDVMASNLMMWEVIKFGKKLGLKKFDMWGSLGPNADTKDPWYGFHRFKEGYGGELIEFVGSFDFVINKKLYVLYLLLNKIRWTILRLR